MKVLSREKVYTNPAGTASGAKAKVQEQLNSVRNAGEVYYAAHNNYGVAGSATDCTAGDMAADTVSGFLQLVTVPSVWPPDNVLPTCVDNADVSTDATAFAAWHAFTDGTYWCVDSSGVAKSEPSAPASTDTACP